jgi:hypothetical protein
MYTYMNVYVVIFVNNSALFIDFPIYSFFKLYS